LDKLPNVAYETPGGKHVVIVANTSDMAQTFQIRFHGESILSTLSGGAVGTYVW
jgi:glucosylceramidase